VTYVTADDTQLYEQWRGGDRDAGTKLVERHYDSVHRFLATKAGPHADDLVQRTFLACANLERGYRGESSFRAYLFGVARYILFEYFRGRVRDGKIDPDFSVSSACELAPGPSTFASDRVEQRLLVQALRSLPLDIQMTLELFYWEEMSVGELAAALEIPPGTVKSRLFRGRTLLKEAMEAAPMTPDETASVRLLLADWAENMRARLA
jgi:RNA polymerase sigma-70 factor (ECF subfamily)